MKTLLSIALGVVTAIGGFLDAGTVATAGEAGAKFGLGLVWAILLSTVAIVLLVEMTGRFAAVSEKTYASAIRENFGIKFFLLPLASEVIAESILLTAEIGGMAIAISLITGISWHVLFPVAVLLVFASAWRAPFSWIENGPALLGLVTLSFIIRKIITADGNVIGHVADIELTPAPEFKVTGLFYGRRGWLHRLHLVNPFGSRKRHKPDRVPWDAVERLEKSAIRLKPGVNVRDWAALE